MILPVILAGGSGSRLWPLSRDLLPKQFLPLHGGGTMLQSTVQRLSALATLPPLVICNEQHRFIAAEQLRQINQLQHNIMLEPAGRNTAPAIALAALFALQQGNDAILLVLAADHVISDTPAFTRAVEQATALAASGKLVTFGIVPTSAETGYGYIKRGAAVSPAYTVAQFVEKPDLKTAEHYLHSGDYYWNSGMFMFTASRYLQELQQFRPDMYAACEQAMSETNPDLDFIRVNTAAFLACKAESVDYAVMEQTAAALVLPLDAGWSDIGAWSSLWNISSKDAAGNVHKGDVLSNNSSNNLVIAESALVATVGLNNAVVVQTQDAVLVAAKDQVQDVKAIVAKLQAANRPEHKIHREVYRPWGRYELLASHDGFQVKRITVNPGAGISTQYHQFRAEHWVVVSGIASVTLADVSSELLQNQSLYIPAGVVHSLENRQHTPLQLIEVQTGNYLGEDDIVRLADRYGRV